MTSPAHEIVDYANLAFDINMMASALILVVTFVAIFTEAIHKVHRTKVAMTGAAAMVFTGQAMGFYTPDGAVEAIDWNVVYDDDSSHYDTYRRVSGHGLFYCPFQ
jgi:hypothetical protein